MNNPRHETQAPPTAHLASHKARIQSHIDAEMKKLVPCSLTLTRLKKARLKAKDRLAMLQAGTRAKQPLRRD